MNLEEIKNAITFERFETQDGKIAIRGTLSIQAVEFVDKLSYDSIPTKDRVVDMMEERVATRIIRNLYEDQRAKLDMAIMDLMMAHPYDAAELNKAKSKILQCAMHQQPPT